MVVGMDSADKTNNGSNQSSRRYTIYRRACKLEKKELLYTNGSTCFGGGINLQPLMMESRMEALQMGED